MFVDETKVHVRAGDGGAGVTAFKSVRGRPKGKPEGGSGGRGGDVWAEANPEVATLLGYKRRPHRRAGDGTHGKGDLQHGRSGDDLILQVPVGTVVKDEDDLVVADLVEPGQRVRLARGGRGGRGNAAFVSRKHHAPSFSEQGEYGQEAWFTLELKLLADAAIVGYPNVGKSTLISRISAAKPKIADYPFTTLEPNLGVVTVSGREFVVADIPGLIEGAADGKGLGHEFLRHVERARALVVAVDASLLQTVDVVDQHRVLVDELRRHDPVLARRPHVLVVLKADLPEAEEAAERLREAVDEPVHLVSAVTGAGLEGLLHAVADAVDLAERSAPDRRGFVLHRPLDEGFEITRSGDTWVVTGRVAERAVGLDDLTRPEAADVAARRLRRSGVEDALRSAGAVPGDEVRIGTITFEFRDEDEEDEPFPEELL